MDVLLRLINESNISSSFNLVGKKFNNLSQVSKFEYLVFIIYSFVFIKKNYISFY